MVLLTYCVFEVSDLGGAVGVRTVYGDDIYAPVSFQFGVGLQVGLSRGDQMGALFGGDGFFGVAVGRGCAGFDFYEDGDFRLSGDDVDLAVGCAGVALEDSVSAPGEVLGGEGFAPASDGLEGGTHLRQLSTMPRIRVRRLRLCPID